MTQLLRWGRRAAVTLAVLMLMAWIWAWGTQWVLRWRAQRLLADVRTIELSRTSAVEAERLLKSWSKWDTRSEYDCSEKKCSMHFIVVPDILPNRHFFTDDRRPYESQWWPTLLRGVGLRDEGVIVKIFIEHDVVTSMSFAVVFEPGPSVSSGEELDLVERFGKPIEHPYRVAHHNRLGLEISFQPEEDASEKIALMDFNLSCLTRFQPCDSEQEVLSEGWRLSQERERANDSTH